MTQKTIPVPPAIIRRFAEKNLANQTKAEKRLFLVLEELTKGTPYKVQRQGCFYDSDAKKWYLVDFYIQKIGLVIEVDGRHHWDKDQKELDKKRTACFDKFFIQVVRIENEEVFSGEITTKIRQVLQAAERRRVANNKFNFARLYFVESKKLNSKTLNRLIDQFLRKGGKITRCPSLKTVDESACSLFQEEVKDIYLTPHCVSVGGSDEVDKAYYMKKRGRTPYEHGTLDNLVPNGMWFMTAEP